MASSTGVKNLRLHTLHITHYGQRKSEQQKIAIKQLAPLLYSSHTPKGGAPHSLRNTALTPLHKRGRPRKILPGPSPRQRQGQRRL
ncbi:hypothetical protein TNCV_318851 [Trichonephila clavipes]|nr:hypothetical protein TNCV_318851 [Trichonephila clavipes]